MAKRRTLAGEVFAEGVTLHAGVPVHMRLAPAVDGDALSFVRLFDKGGLREVEGPRDMIRVLREVQVASGDARASLLPAAQAEFFFEIEFASAAIGRQSFECAFTEVVFRRDIAPA